MRGIKRQAFWLGFLVSLIAIFAFFWALPTWAATLSYCDTADSNKLVCAA